MKILQQLKRISPLWSEAIPQYMEHHVSKIMIRGRRLNMSDMWNCVVGEAHGFTRPDCSKCRSFGFAFCDLGQPAGLDSREGIADTDEELIEKFIEHFMSQHSNMLQEAKQP